MGSQINIRKYDQIGFYFPDGNSYFGDVKPTFVGVKPSFDYIFKKLGLSERAKYELASEAYGFSCNKGVWPSFKTSKYEQLENLLYLLKDRYGLKITVRGKVLPDKQPVSESTIKSSINQLKSFKNEVRKENFKNGRAIEQSAIRVRQSVCGLASSKRLRGNPISYRKS